MRLSGSYFKKMDDFAKWILGRQNSAASATATAENAGVPKTADPQTQPELDRKGYVSFRNEGPSDRPSPAISKIILDARQAKSERSQAVDVLQSSRFIKKSARGNLLPSSRQGCTICLDAEANGVLMDCGHGAICFECGLALLNSTCECHLCRQPVIQVLKIDTSYVHDDLLKVLEAADLHNIIKYNHTRETLHTADL